MPTWGAAWLMRWCRCGDCRVALDYPVVKLLDWNARRAELETSQNAFAVVVLAHLMALETREAAE